MTHAQKAAPRDLMEACRWAGIPYPVTESDLDRTMLALLRLGVRHNLENEPSTQEAIARARWAERNLCGGIIRNAMRGGR